MVEDHQEGHLVKDLLTLVEVEEEVEEEEAVAEEGSKDKKQTKKNKKERGFNLIYFL